MSESNRVALRYVAETVYNTTPTDSANWKTMRYTSETLSGTPTTTESAEIRSDRMIADQAKMGLQVGGDISVEMSATSFDDFIEAAVCGTWTSNELEVGSTDRSFTLEKEFADISRFVKMSGVRVGGMSLNFQYGAILTGGFTFAGAGITTGNTSAVGAGTVAAATTTTILNASSDVGTLNIDGAPSSIYLRTINLNLDNGLRAIEAIGHDAPVDQKKGTARITGSIEAYLDASSFEWYSKIINQTPVEIEFSVSDADGNSYTFLLPSVKLTGSAPQSGGLDQDVMVSADFTALYDAAEMTSLRITRVAA